VQQKLGLRLGRPDSIIAMTINWTPWVQLQNVASSSANHKVAFCLTWRSSNLDKLLSFQISAIFGMHLLVILDEIIQKREEGWEGRARRKKGER